MEIYPYYRKHNQKYYQETEKEERNIENVTNLIYDRTVKLT